ncbi:MAG: leucine-rich repeat domain-containing protein [Candidatus Methylumidiphilus sp.]
MTPDTEGQRIARARIAEEAEQQTGYLYLGRLGLTELPEELFALKHLRRLNLGYGLVDGQGRWIRAASDIKANALANDHLARLSALPHLQALSISEMPIADLSPLAGLAALRTLNCNLTKVANLSPLAGLAALQSLDCNATPVADLSPLAGLAALRTLDCCDTPVADLSPVAGLTALQSLDCSFTPVANLSPLAGLAALESLDCSHTQVTDLSPLADLDNLQKLGFSNCQLTRIPAGLWNKPSLEKLRLYQTQIPNIPAEVLSQHGIDNCLYRLRAHLKDLESGAMTIPDIKLMILGNGRVGKTQICRRLKGEQYDDRIDSTHGIEISTVPLKTRKYQAQTQLNLWDFGGQDIYHGTHALFLKTRAIFVLVWSTATESVGEHEHGGMVFRNYPLAYWLEYVRHLAGTDSPVIIVQTRCDRPEDEEPYPPLDNTALADFKFRKLLHYSAWKNRGRAALDEAIRQAVDWLRQREGDKQIGLGRFKVQQRLQTLREADAKIPPAERQYRTISQTHYQHICAETGGVSAPEYLLDYLHNAGVVFYRKGLFKDEIILDQAWALEAIYAVFNRSKSYRPLRQFGGRFTRALLAALVWQDYNPAEQKLFIGMMQSCGVCFQYRDSDEKAGIETEYIAPDLLPDKAQMQAQLADKWQDDVAAEQAEFQYAWLHAGLVRGFMASIGKYAGVNAVYWQTGFAFYEQTHRSRAWVEWQRLDDWQGIIRLQTQGGQAAALLAQLAEYLRDEQQRWGVQAQETSTRKTLAHEESKMNQPLQFAQAETPQREICISYARADETPQGKSLEDIVERFCAAAQQRGIHIIRDKTELGLGDSLIQFMQRIGAGKRVLVVLSDKYLHSANCMYELFEIWRNSKLDKAAFKERAGVYRLPCANIFELEDRSDYAIYWRTKFHKMDAKLRKNGPDILGPQGFSEYKRMQDFALHVGEILDFFKDTLHPGNFEELEQYELDR